MGILFITSEDEQEEETAEVLAEIAACDERIMSIDVELFRRSESFSIIMNLLARAMVTSHLREDGYELLNNSDSDLDNDIDPDKEIGEAIIHSAAFFFSRGNNTEVLEAVYNSETERGMVRLIGGRGSTD